MIDQTFIKKTIEEWNRERRLPDDMVVALIISHQDALLQLESLKVQRDKYSQLYKEFVDGILEKNITKEYKRAVNALGLARNGLESLLRASLGDEERLTIIALLNDITNSMK